LLPDDQVHPDTHVLTMVNNVIGVVNYVIAARPSLRNFVIADTISRLCGRRSSIHRRQRFTALGIAEAACNCKVDHA
jgi:hypothetical protein